MRRRQSQGSGGVVGGKEGREGRDGLLIVNTACKWR